VKDVGFAHLDRVEAEGDDRLQQDGGARDDRGGAVGVQAPGLAPLRHRYRRELAEQPPARVGLDAVAVHPVGIVGLELEVDGGQRGRLAI